MRETVPVAGSVAVEAVVPLTMATGEVDEARLQDALRIVDEMRGRAGDPNDERRLQVARRIAMVPDGRAERDAFINALLDPMVKHRAPVAERYGMVPAIIMKEWHDVTKGPNADGREDLTVARVLGNDTLREAARVVYGTFAGGYPDVATFGATPFSQIAPSFGIKSLGRRA